MKLKSNRDALAARKSKYPKAKLSSLLLHRGWGGIPAQRVSNAFRLFVSRLRSCLLAVQGGLPRFRRRCSTWHSYGFSSPTRVKCEPWLSQDLGRSCVQDKKYRTVSAASSPSLHLEAVEIQVRDGPLRPALIIRKSNRPISNSVHATEKES